VGAGKWQVAALADATHIHRLKTNLAIKAIRYCPAAKTAPKDELATKALSANAARVGRAAEPLAASEPALLGVLDDGQQALLVPRRGAFTFQWSLQGTVDRPGAMRFELSVPQALSTVFEIDLARDLVVKSAEAIVSEEPQGESELR